MFMKKKTSTSSVIAGIVLSATFVGILVGSAVNTARAASMAAAARSSPHNITCWTNTGLARARYENDPNGPYYSTQNHIIFLDKVTHKMLRISSTNCDETWNADASY